MAYWAVIRSAYIIIVLRGPLSAFSLEGQPLFSSLKLGYQHSQIIKICALANIFQKCTP